MLNNNMNIFVPLMFVQVTNQVSLILYIHKRKFIIIRDSEPNVYIVVTKTTHHYVLNIQFIRKIDQSFDLFMCNYYNKNTISTVN